MHVLDGRKTVVRPLAGGLAWSWFIEALSNKAGTIHLVVNKDYHKTGLVGVRPVVWLHDCFATSHVALRLMVQLVVSVRPSVCLSVYLSRCGIVSKGMRISSNFYTCLFDCTN